MISLAGRFGRPTRFGRLSESHDVVGNYYYPGGEAKGGQRGGGGGEGLGGEGAGKGEISSRKTGSGVLLIH